MKLRINEEIREKEVRVTGKNITPGIMSIGDALALADQLGQDLIEINRSPTPTICRVVNYDKFLYEEKKRKKEQDKTNKENRQNLKEVRFGPNTDHHDFEFKKKHIINFLQKGDKVKAFVFFKGREIMFKEKGQILLLKLLEDIEEYGSAEGMPKLEGKRLVVFIKPKKK
jgi:translation initiation factor IF-3